MEPNSKSCTAETNDSHIEGPNGSKVELHLQDAKIFVVQIFPPGDRLFYVLKFYRVSTSYIKFAHTDRHNVKRLPKKGREYLVGPFHSKGHTHDRSSRPKQQNNNFEMKKGELRDD